MQSMTNLKQIPGSTRPNSSKNSAHHKSSSTEFRPQELARALHAKIQQENFDLQKKASPGSKHRKAHSSNVSPLKSTGAPQWSGKTTKGSKKKSISNFSNIFSNAYNENSSKPGSRRSSAQKIDYGSLAESLKKLHNPKKPVNRSPHLSQREEEIIRSLASSQKATPWATPMSKNNPNAASKLDFYSHVKDATANQAKDHRRVLEANFKNMGIQHYPEQHANTPFSKKSSQANIISDIVDIVHDNKKAGRFANNSALQSVFNKVSKYIPRTKQDGLRSSGNNFFHKPQYPQPDTDQQDNVLSRKSSMHALHEAKTGVRNHYLPSFEKVSHQIEEPHRPGSTTKHSNAEIVYPISRRSSQGNLGLGLNSVPGSKENSPRGQGHRKVVPAFRFNEGKEASATGASNKILKLVEPSVQFVLNESLFSKEKKKWKYQPQDFAQENDLDLESMKVYQNLQGSTLIKNSSMNAFNVSTETEKSNICVSTNFNASLLEKALSRLNAPESASKGKKGKIS